jgi:hypothetical protein
MMKIFNDQGRRQLTPEEELDYEVLIKRCQRVCPFGDLLWKLWNDREVKKEMIKTLQEIEK